MMSTCSCAPSSMQNGLSAVTWCGHRPESRQQCVRMVSLQSLYSTKAKSLTKRFQTRCWIIQEVRRSVWCFVQCIRRFVHVPLRFGMFLEHVPSDDSWLLLLANTTIVLLLRTRSSSPLDNDECSSGYAMNVVYKKHYRSTSYVPNPATLLVHYEAQELDLESSTPPDAVESSTLTEQTAAGISSPFTANVSRCTGVAGENPGKHWRLGNKVVANVLSADARCSAGVLDLSSKRWWDSRTIGSWGSARVGGPAR
jgi:hypothetical protein